jgi:diaminopimelate decarboxylase
VLTYRVRFTDGFIGSDLILASFVLSMKVRVSGVHSDPDPSPGIGIALSLRDAFPHAVLQAVDYSVRSSGLHHPVFDDVLLQSAWSELDLETYSLQIRDHLDQQNGFFLSGLDAEIDWLAQTIHEHPRLLSPSQAAQQVVRKPVLDCADSLHMRVPEYLPANCAPADLHELGRRSGWHLWVKGKYHEAYSAHSFVEMRRQIMALESHWPIEDIFIQQHIRGQERAITFAAYQGQLLDAVEIEKRSITSQGKTWAASVTAAPADIVERLASLVEVTRWSGGGEVEFVRTQAGENWLIDFNPRFPAYIHGVTICGHNMPASLVCAALGIDVPLPRETAQQFIRVVQELPVRADLPLTRIIAPAAGYASVGKHPSFQPSLVRKLQKKQMTVSANQRPSMLELPEFLSTWQTPSSTPLRFRDFSSTDDLLSALAKTLELCDRRPRVIPALSIKTDPHRDLARAFLDREWWAEVISLQELEWVRQMGFKNSQIIFNGPAVVALDSIAGQSIAAAFADSADAFEALVKSHSCEVIGLRLRVGTTNSRFGVDLTDFKSFSRVVKCLSHHKKSQRLGIHMHLASDISGPVRWNDVIEHSLVWAEALSMASGSSLSVFDIGGGWHPDDFSVQFLPALPELIARIAQAIPSIQTILLEPGKAVSADTAWLATRIIEVRSCDVDGLSEVVVDSSIADLPMAMHYAHRILHLRNGSCLGWLGGGRQRILGSICMEIDILAERIEFLQPPAVGDLLLFSSAGGYNASMAWDFASGVSRDT